MSDWNPADYHKHSDAQMAWAAELIAKLALTGNERVLDIGCGDGKVTAQIARAARYGLVLGVDSSEEMVRFAREAFGADEFPNLSFRVCDARRLPFCEEFDIIFSNATLHWVVDHRPVLAGIAMGLRPGGQAVLQMGGEGNAADVVAVVAGVIAEERWRDYFGGFEFPYGFHGAEIYREWIVEADLTPVRVELIAKDMAKPGPEGLAGWVRTTWMPYTHRVPEALREEFIAEIVSRYVAAHPADADGTVHVRMMRLEVEARKG
jgi:trans-aconitate methyltransferase